LTVNEVAARGFSRAAAVYERARPGYAAEAVAWLCERLRIGPGRDVVDLAAGTGKLTRDLVPTRARIVAVEPLDEMRSRLVEVAPSNTTPGRASSGFRGRRLSASLRPEAMSRAWAIRSERCSSGGSETNSRMSRSRSSSAISSTFSSPTGDESSRRGSSRLPLVKPRFLLVLAGCTLLLSAALPALAAKPKAVNLVATTRVKAKLRASFLLFHHKYNRRYTSKNVRGPLRGTTYYGRYGKTEYAFATFSLSGDTTDQPELFKRRVGGLFRDIGDTGGEICKSRMPLALIKVWHLRRSSPGCFVRPR